MCMIFRKTRLKIWTLHNLLVSIKYVHITINNVFKNDHQIIRICWKCYHVAILLT